MAKRKLSQKGRASVRRDMKRMLGRRTKPSEILAAIAKKYPIGVESARWYLRTLTSDLKAGKRGSRNGDIQIPDVVRAYTEAGLRRVIAAKKLVPKLEDLLREKRKLQKALERTEDKARKIEKRIRVLTG